MAKDTGRKWRNRLVIVCAKNRVADANAAIASWGWGPEFFGVPFRSKTDGTVKEYAADVVLSDEMLAKLHTLVPGILKLSDFEKPATKAKGSAPLKEIALKRDVNIRGRATIDGNIS